MRIIQRQISLEPMTSRLPGLYPAYKDGELYFFDKDHLDARGHEFPTNWGMIPVLLRLNHTPSTSYGCDDYSVSCTGTFTMSWERLSQWYNFFEEYYRLLNDYGHCGIKYKSAIDYYNNESRTKYAEQMKYGIDEKTYEKMDEIFKERGGKAVLGKDSNNCITGTTDTGFFCWLRKNIVKTSDTSQTNVNTINSTIKAQFDPCTGKWNNDCFVTSMNGGINLQVSIDDMGEFGIFCSEYNLGESYYSDVIYRDGKSMTIKKGELGYRYDEIYKEMVIEESDWEDYTASYIDNHDYYVLYNGKTYYGVMSYDGGSPSLKVEIDDIEYTAQKDTNSQWYITIDRVKYYFASAYSNDYSYYGFKSDGTKVTGDTVEDVKNQLITLYPIVEKPGVLINGDIYLVNKEEYVEYSGKTYYVLREKDTETPYTYFNGKKVYAAFDIRKMRYLFSFSSKEFWRTRTTTADLKEYISYNGGNYPVSGNAVTIDNIVFLKTDGYFNSDEGTLYYSGDTVYRWYGMQMEMVSGYTRDGNNFKKTDESPVVYTTGKITGTTASKLETLRSTDALMDDAGYVLPGRYNYREYSGKTNSQPQEGEELDLLYEVGNTANIMPYKKTKTLDELIKTRSNENYFVGDIISAMTFYYKDVDGKKYPQPSGKAWSGSSLSTINSVTKPTNVILKSENIFCDITYLIGATLVREEGGNFKPYEDGSLGVIYTETVEFEKKNVEYHLKNSIKKSTPMEKTKPRVHSVSYPVACYTIKERTNPTASFLSDTFKCQNGTVETYENDDVSNNTLIFPSLRFEYMFGSATMQNVEADIYIDRGINAALDKHLKLGEVTSMEALESYGIDYFKLMNN